MMIPVNEPLLGQQEMDYVAECVKTGWISSAGHFLTEFETRWAAYCSRRYGIGVCNGTTALHLATACIDLKPGDEVILPTFTIISCAQAVTVCGGVPVLVDADPRTWNMDVSQLESKITSHTRAIMPVHIYGHPVDMDPVLALADEHGLRVIEDAAEAHGAEYLTGRENASSNWRKCGSMGTLSVFSFYANKLITTGEGGMVLTDDERLAERLRALRNLCFRSDRRFYHTELGYNYRLTNLQAAIGVAQIERMNEIIARKRWMGARYTEELKNIPGLQLPVEESWARSVYWMYGIVLDDESGLDAQEFAQRLKKRGVETRPFFLGMHAQPAFHAMGLFRDEHYPIADRIARQGLYLPSSLVLSEAQLLEVCEAVKESLSHG